MPRFLPAAAALAVVTLVAGGPLAAGAGAAAPNAAAKAGAKTAAHAEVGGELLSLPGVHVRAKAGETIKPLP